MHRKDADIIECYCSLILVIAYCSQTALDIMIVPYKYSSHTADFNGKGIGSPTSTFTDTCDATLGIDGLTLNVPYDGSGTCTHVPVVGFH